MPVRPTSQVPVASVQLARLERTLGAPSTMDGASAAARVPGPCCACLPRPLSLAGSRSTPGADKWRAPP
eukprot:1153166-Lingulodinium_polyedra.AAC.1